MAQPVGVIGSTAGTLGFDAHSGCIHICHYAAVFAIEALLHVIEQVLQQGVVHSPSPPAGDGGVAMPTALRTSTKFISCFSAVM